MPLYHILVLALIQGLTEFLPVSSSGHLVLSHYLLGNSNTDLCWETNRMMDVAVHVGTLFSVLIYFKKDLVKIACGMTNPQSDGFKLFQHIIIASIPVIIVGFIIQQYQFSLLCMIEIMAWMMLFFGVILWFADKFDSDKTLDKMSNSNAFIIGLSQALALIPGVSRSGITMTSARFLGFTRVEATRFSLLLSIIAISGAGALSGFDLIQENALHLGVDILIAVILAFLSGWIAIALMIKWLSKATFLPFVIYRIILGSGLLILIYSGIL